jgi:hypothetical protein
MNSELESPDPAADVAAAMQSAAGAVLVALSHVEESGGIGVSGQMAAVMIRIATIYTLERVGPAAARNMLAGAWADRRRDRVAELRLGNFILGTF